MWILGYMSGFSHSAAIIKASSCLLVLGRDNTEHFENTSYGFCKVSVSIVPFVIDLFSIWVWQCLLPPLGWFTDVRALMQMCMDAAHPAGESVDALMTSGEWWEKHQSPFHFCHHYGIRARCLPHHHDVRSFFFLFVVRDGIQPPCGIPRRAITI